MTSVIQGAETKSNSHHNIFRRFVRNSLEWQA